MAKYLTDKSALAYPAIEIVVDEVWRKDGSLFRPGEAVWTTENLTQLDGRLAHVEGLSGTFLDKLEAQLLGCDPQAVQLMAELLYVHLLVPNHISGSTKRNQVLGVLSWADLQIEFPAAIEAAFDGGLINTGQWYASRRDLQLGYLVTASLAWRRLDSAGRDQLLTDPWAFAAWAQEVNPSLKVAAQRNALLHLVHPDSFEPIVVDDHKQAIVDHWADLAPDEGTIDQKLLAVRAELEATGGTEVNWYSEELKPQWQPDATDRTGDDDDDGGAASPSSAVERRHARYALMVRAWERDVEATDTYQRTIAIEAADAETVERALGVLRTTGDIVAFVAQSAELASVKDRPPVRNFWAHLRNKVARNDLTARRLAEIVSLPESDTEAAARIADLETIMREAGAVQNFVGASGLALGALWTRGKDSRYPEFYENAEVVARLLGWLDDEESRHTAYWQLLRELEPAEPRRAASVLLWAKSNFSGLDASIAARCAENVPLAEAYSQDRRYPDSTTEDLAHANILAVRRELELAAGALKDAIPAALDQPLRGPRYSNLRASKTGPFRSDARFRRRATDIETSVEFCVWVTAAGVFVGLWPTWSTNEETRRIARIVLPAAPTDFELFAWNQGAERLTRVATTEVPHSSFLLGRHFTFDEALDNPAFGSTIVDVAHDARALFATVAEAETVPESVVIEEVPEGGDEFDQIQAAADDLLIDRRHLDEIVDLLEEKGKGQVILYGPPGTGKTFLARRLARAMVDEDDQRWRLVQFHPSTSYEDFFEGYRPITVDGAMRYELRPGPLARIAAAAAADAQHRYVLIIDEINRANLPKVFGELLYLLEYRDQPVRSLYRPDDDFRLPANLFIIGTMNTADRSIGLVDAAMRRRFRFVGFFPDTEPMASLLDRWLEENGGSPWVSALVTGVNEELAESLGRDLQLGPSYFMVSGLDETSMARVWRHSVQPFIEDQFFGDQGRIDQFSWDQVWKRHGPRGTELAGEPPSDRDDLADEPSPAGFNEP